MSNRRTVSFNTVAPSEPGTYGFGINVRDWTSMNALSTMGWIATLYYTVIAVLALIEASYCTIMSAKAWAIVLTMSPGYTLLIWGICGYTYTRPSVTEKAMYDQRHMDPMFGQICYHFVLTVFQMVLAWVWYTKWEGSALDVFNSDRYDTAASVNQGTVLLYAGWYMILTLVILGLPLVLSWQYESWRRHQYPLKSTNYSSA